VLQPAADRGPGREEPDSDQQHLAQPGLGGLLACLELVRVRGSQGGRAKSLIFFHFRHLLILVSPLKSPPYTIHSFTHIEQSPITSLHIHLYQRILR
jgi:hypothetical protein